MVSRLRRFARDNAVLRRVLVPLMATRSGSLTDGDWLICPMYHDMRAGERRAFERQIRFMRSLGEFVSLDIAIGLLERPRLGGRYFCLTFDDGYWGAYAYAQPVLAAEGVASAFFVVPRWMDGATAGVRGFKGKYLTWGMCRDLSGNGVTIGSHSEGHARLATLSHAEAWWQMETSRRRIEAETSVKCEHFACPWGQPGDDYLPARDPSLARMAGYKSFLTTVTRRAVCLTDRFEVPRVRLEAGWGVNQLRYMFGRQ